MKPHTLRTLLALTSAGLLLTGCAGNVVDPAPIETVQAKTAQGQAGKAKQPDKPVPMSVATFQALRGDGLYYFDNAAPSRFFVSESIATNGRWPVEEEFRRGASHGFTWGSGAAAILRNGRALDPQAAESVSVEKNGDVILHFKSGKGSKETLTLRLKLEAYDLSGLPIGYYLVTRSGRSTPAGYFIGERYVFPQGSVGYRAVLTTPKDEVIVPTKQAFSGSETIEAFSQRFTKEIPYCLRYIPGKRSEPIGLRFDEPIQKKTVKQKGKTVEAAQKGEVELYEVKKGTLFCAKEKERSIGEADWNLRWVNGTRTISFTFPEHLNPEDYGVAKAHRDALRVALAQEKAGKKTKLVPARLWLAGKPITDYQWRFNRKAAEAIEAALKATEEKREAWEAKQKRPQLKNK